MPNRDFRCDACGSEELAVARVYTEWTEFTEILLCRCLPLNTQAAVRRGCTTIDWCEEGWLGRNHQPYWKSRRLFGLPYPPLAEWDRAGLEVLCHVCFQKAADEDEWLLDEESSLVERGAATYEVCCASCSREIEFGWGAPDGRQGIWPAECADFDPTCVWPEPRYRTAWEERGWIPAHGESNKGRPQFLTSCPTDELPD